MSAPCKGCGQGHGHLTGCPQKPKGYGAAWGCSCGQTGTGPDTHDCPLARPTLRDRFAMAALPGILVAAYRLDNPDGAWRHEDIVRDAFQLADAMLAERAKGQP